MDLFGKLPTPSSEKKSSSASKINPAAQPFLTSPAADLFGDLPDSTNSTEGSNGTKHTENLVPPSSSSSANKQEAVKRKSLDDAESSGVKRLNTGTYLVHSYLAERKGEREDMQDATVLIDHFNDRVPNLSQHVSRLSFYAVYDGHGGARASKYAASNLHTSLANRFPKGDIAKIEAEIKKCFTEVFKKTDEEFLKQASKQKPSWKDGTTASTALIINNTIYVANVGDSKAIVCRWNDKDKKFVGLTLTKEHNPSQYEERMRIQKAGGQVRDGRVMGILEVSRSLGDGPYKNHGVSAMPDMRRCQLTDNDKFLLIACDGLWKTFTNDAAIQLVNKVINDETIKGTDTKSSEEVRWETACNMLASEAVRRLSADNVSVILVKIGKKDMS